MANFNSIDLVRGFRLGSRINERAKIDWSGYDLEQLAKLDPSLLPSAPQYGDVGGYDVTKGRRGQQALISGVIYGESVLGWLYDNNAFSADRLVFAQGKNIFPDYATSWEKEWSVLCGQGNFVPVAAELPLIRDMGLATVIGHRGSVDENNLVCYGQPTLNKGVGWVGGNGVMYVHNKRDTHLPPGQTPYFVPQTNYEVLAAVDGTVLAILGAKDREALKDANWIIDIVLAPMLANRLVGLLRGPQMCSTLSPNSLRAGASYAGRRLWQGFRGMMRGPTAEALAGIPAVDTTVMTLGREAALEMRGLKLLNGYDPRIGVPKSFFDAQVETALETDTVPMFRANKQAATELMERAAPKPQFFKFKSDPSTGILTCQTADDFRVVAEHEYYVVGEDGVARRTVLRNGQKVTEELQLDNPYWQKRPNQVIHPDGNPVVGDVDMSAVLPNASPGQNLVLVPKDVNYGDWKNPHVTRYAEAFNAKLRRPFIMHGSQDGFVNAKFGGLTDDLAYVTYPDGKLLLLEGRIQQEAFFDAYGRQTVMGSYR